MAKLPLLKKMSFIDQYVSKIIIYTDKVIIQALDKNECVIPMKFRKYGGKDILPESSGSWDGQSQPLRLLIPRRGTA